MIEFRTGYGAPWLDFLVTRVGRYRPATEELLPQVADLRRWFREYGMEPGASITDADLAWAHEVREAIHRTTHAVVRSESADAGDLRVIEKALESDRPVTVRKRRDQLSVTRPASTAEALARLARGAVTDLSGPQRTQLRKCDDQTCSGIFLDHTGRRRWCSDARCGVRARVRAHRARARES